MKDPVLLRHGVVVFAGQALCHNRPDDNSGARKRGGLHDAVHEPRHRNPFSQAEAARAEGVRLHAALLHRGKDDL